MRWLEGDLCWWEEQSCCTAEDLRFAHPLADLGYANGVVEFECQREISGPDKDQTNPERTPLGWSLMERGDQERLAIASS